MSEAWILLHTLIAIIIIIFLLVRWRINPAIGLVIGAIYLGVITNQGLSNTISSIATGFGNIMTGIGLVIGFGILLGSLLLAAGGVHRIAESLLNISGTKRSPYALTSTGLIVSTPVFYDVGYVIMAPIARTLTKRTPFSIAVLGAALVFGLGIAHTFIPPTPGPIVGAELLGVSLGDMFIFGALVAVPTAWLGLYLYMIIAGKPGFWNSVRDEEFSAEEIDESSNISMNEPVKRLSLSSALWPIALPIILILSGTFTRAIGIESDVITFLSDKVTALLIGLLLAYWVASNVLSKSEVNRAIEHGMKDSGIVLLITGAGGSFAAVIQLVGVGDILGGYFSEISGSSFLVILMVWFIAGLLRAAQGSGTVAMITAISIIAPAISSGLIDMSPVLVALAAFSGSLLCAHINDSGFWITTKLLGLSTVGGLKVYTLSCLIMSVISLVFVFLLNLVV